MGEGTGRNGYYSAQVSIDAIPGSAGIISTIAVRVGCAWHTAKKYCTRETTPFVTVAQAYEDECATVLDMAEGKCLAAIKSGDGPMIRYYLSTKGKHRGYTDRRQIEHTGKDGGAIVIDDARTEYHSRALASLADALGGLLAEGCAGEPGAVDAAESATVGSGAKSGG